VLVAPQPVDIGGKTMPALPIDWMMIGITALTSFTLLIYGYHLFNKLKWRFVERG
jgi:hypothetical protein